MLPPSCVFLLSAIELLPELLFESEQKADFCKTPVGEDPNCWLLSHPSVPMLRDELSEVTTLLEVLVKASPKGPHIEVPQDFGIQFVSFWVGSLRSLFNPKSTWVGSNSRYNLRGDRASFSRLGEDDDENSEAIGIDIDS